MPLNETQAPRRRMSEDDVLAVLRDWQSRSGDCDESPVDFKTPLDEALLHIGLEEDLGWNGSRCLRKTIEKSFHISIARDRWKAALYPWRRHTLRHLCELIAGQAMVAEIRPITVFGRRCLPAGAFLAVRGALAEAGIDMAGISPSTPLEPTLKRRAHEVNTEMTKLASGKLPLAEVAEPLPVRAGETLFAFGMLATILAVVAAWLGNAVSLVYPLAVMLAIPGLAVLLLSAALLTMGMLFPPGRATMGDLKTFRDLCLALVDSIERENHAPTR